MFLTCRAKGPAARATIVTISEHDVDWSADLITRKDQTGQAVVEPTPEWEERWMSVVTNLAAMTLLRQVKTWRVGGNIDGKSQGLTMFTGGFNKHAEASVAGKESGHDELSFQPSLERTGA